MNKKLAIAGVLCWAMLGAVPVHAFSLTTGNSIKAIQAEQERMIQQGYRSGALTDYERRVLVRQQARIKEIEQRYRLNGLQGWERRQLLVMLKWAGKSIIHKLNNDERRLQVRNLAGESK